MVGETAGTAYPLSITRAATSSVTRKQVSDYVLEADAGRGMPSIATRAGGEGIDRFGGPLSWQRRWRHVPSIVNYVVVKTGEIE